DGDPEEPECKFVVAKKLCDVVQDVKKTFKDNGVDECDAEWIVSLSLGIKRSELGGDNFVSPKNIEKIDAWAKERITGRPLAYVVGDADFFGYKIIVNENVLIPRPETEELVESACKVIDSESDVLDLCTGSGAIAIAVKMKTGARVYASDISSGALEVARKNAELNGAEIEFIQSDLFEKTDRKFDVIISNPPYIKTADIDLLDREIKDFEPTIALDGGEDGYDFYRRIASDAPEFLSENGVLFLECGEGQADTIFNMLSSFGKKEIIKDINGIDRIIKAVK
ncbi:MAG: peptide chain release factor N(5)-glutamine methyltransferase, partial [Clostridia bacterium]|nr:peptide chain release factor N(5)-glutamine methyltransferase [Clostridia bacterium]